MVGPVDTEIRPLLSVSLPIHTLPAEVLIQIFQHFLPSHDSFIDRTGSLKCPWARLICVCRRWCALIRNTACFWTDIDVRSRETRWLEVALFRSGGAPIRIVLWHNFEAVVPLLLKHVYHIEGLSFREPIHESFVAPFLSRSFPILKHLELLAERSSHPPLFPTLSSSRLQTLTTLVLTRVSLPWTPSLFSGLELLSLTHCRLSAPPLPFADFLDLLEHGQKLRQLRLEHFLSVALSPQTVVPLQRVVTLPELQHLVCHDLPAHVAQLMTHLHTPAISSIELQEARDDPNNFAGVNTALTAKLLPEDLTRVPALQAISSLHFTHWAGQRLLSCAGPIKLRMSVNEHLSIWDMEPELLRLPMVFGSALTELRLDGILSFSATTWDILFDAFPALQTLSLNDYGWAPEPTMADDLFRSLQSASTSHNDNTRDPEIGEVHRPVRCAVLKELTIDPVWWIPRTVVAVLECLRSRAAGGTPRLEHLMLGTRVPGPAYEKIKEHDVERLRELVDQFTLVQ